MPSILEQYPISDFAEWNQKKTLILNPHFQRRNIWTPAARSYLIDTILRRMPVPKIYLRTKIQPKNKPFERWSMGSNACEPSSILLMDA